VIGLIKSTRPTSRASFRPNAGHAPRMPIVRNVGVMTVRVS
jgi:hypothetical protein